MAGPGFSTLTAEWVDGALVVYDSAHTAVVTLNSSGLNWVGGVTISSAVLVNAPTLSTANLSTSTLSVANISTATMSVATISTATITTSVFAGGIVSTSKITTSEFNGGTISTATITTSYLNACTLSTGNLSTSTLSVANISTATLTGNTVVSTSLSIDAGIFSQVGLKAQTIIVDTTLTISSAGTLISVTASDVILTLPGAGSSGAIATYKIVNAINNATGQIVIKTATTELIKGGYGFSSSTGVSMAANTGATHKYGDFISLVNQPASTSWGVIGLVGVWATTT